MIGVGIDWEQQADIFAAEAVAAGRPTEWFDRLYSAGRRGEVDMPWDRGRPNLLLAEWTEGRRGEGRSALVVGCGLGQESELIGGLGYDTTAFDVSPTAIRTINERFPDSPVRYRVDNLLAPSPDLIGAFDLVVEIFTVQALPESVRAQATENVARFLAPGGTLFVVAVLREDDVTPDGPPWPLTRAQIEAFAQHGSHAVEITPIDMPGERHFHRVRAVFRRD